MNKGDRRPRGQPPGAPEASNLFMKITVVHVKACKEKTLWREGECLLVAFLISSLCYVFIIKSY